MRARKGNKMTLKKERRNRAKEIRRATGLSLPVASYVAKHGALVVGSTATGAVATEARENVFWTETNGPNTCGCCQEQGFFAVYGPRGEYRVSYY